MSILLFFLTFDLAFPFLALTHTDILTYHVIPGSLYRGGMHDESLHTFEEVDRLTLDRDRAGPKIDEGRFTSWDISADNGVIHKISGVLVPDSVKGQI